MGCLHQLGQRIRSQRFEEVVPARHSARRLNAPTEIVDGVRCVTTDKRNGIENDANVWATETMGNANYPLELFLRVITVSLETMKLVNALPPIGAGLS